MRIIFAGTPEFAVPSLAALVASSHAVVAVYTQPDRPAGRGQHLAMSPVKQFALDHKIAVLQPETLRQAQEQEQLREFKADVMIVVAYGMILPAAVLQIPRLGCINVHASLLPRWRGAAPIQRAILAGDPETGVTIMQIDEGLDTGPMLLKAHCAIEPTDTGASLHHKLAKLGSEALLTTLQALDRNSVQAQKQDDTAATIAKKISKQEGEIDWQQSAVSIDRQVRAFNPWPGAYCSVQGQLVKVWEVGVVGSVFPSAPLLSFRLRNPASPKSPAHPSLDGRSLEQNCVLLSPSSPPRKQGEEPSAGTILNSGKQGIDVLTGDGVLRLLRIQLPGGKSLPVSDVLHAKAQWFAPGVRFDPPHKT